jgi:4-amino-4-deoxy-L-arabinose transferase-like glycosyltransferase
VRNYTYLFLSVSLLVFLFGSLTKLNLPLAEWDHISLAAAESWSKGINTPWIFDHPPLYPFFLTIVFKFTGPGQQAARAANLLCVILTCFVLFRFTADIFDKDTALWSVILYLLSPVCIQGTQLMDVADTSLLPLTFLLIANSMKNNISTPGPKNTTILSFVIALSLWAKVTSTLAFLVAILISYSYLYFFRSKREQNPPTPLNFAALGLGLVLFVLTWTLVSTLSWGNEAYFSVLKAPWNAIHGRVAETSFLSRIFVTGYETIRLFVWFSPYLILMWLTNSWRILGTKSQIGGNHESVKILLACTIIFYFFGNLIIGGTNWGYPRYHDAILPFICVVAGNYVAISLNEFNKNLLVKLLMIVSLSVIITTYVLEDPLLFLNLRVKELLLSGNELGEIAKKTIMTFLPFYVLPVILFCLWFFVSRIRSRSNIFAILLIFCSLSTLVSLDIQQIFASYRTSNQYGASGKVQVLQKVRDHVSNGDYVLATPEFIYELHDKRVPDVGWNIWKSKDIFYRFIGLNTPQAIIVGLTVNTHGQLKWLLNKDSEQILENNYKLSRIGTYYLWLRNHDVNTLH